MSASQQTFIVKGMDCAGCAQSVETAVCRLSGVESGQINFATERLRVTGPISADQIRQTVEQLGYQLEADEKRPLPKTAPEKAPNFWQFMLTRSDTRLALLGGLLILPCLLFNELFPMLGIEHPLFDWLALGALLTAGAPIARSAWRTLIASREIGINLLMCIAAVGAVIIGAPVEAGLVMVLFALGEALEGYTADKARHAVASLASLIPTRAYRLLSDGQAEAVDVETLRIGDRLLVKPGDRLPMDGVVLAGETAVNQAPITGESQLVEKRPGDTVFAGSINGHAALEIEVTRRVEDNSINRMITLVTEAQERKAPAQRLVDRFAKVYTPAVVALAVLVAAVPPLVWNQPFWNTPTEQGWLYRALELLVIACPCALVISTPVTVISGLIRASRAGVLIKGGTYLEMLARLETVAFDKTGTLTMGEPTVVRVQAVACEDPAATLDCAACEDLLAVAGAVEQQSEHPLAKAIVSETAVRGANGRYPAATNVQATVGLGVTGQVGDEQIFLGSHRYFDEHIAHSDVHCADIQDMAAQGQTPILISRDGAYAGMIALADQVRDSSRQALASLRQLGIHQLVMLTGDATETAVRIGQQVGLTDVRAGLLPEQKLDAIEQLRLTGPVAMVGDGINDAPALAAADVGIAMGAAGSPQALETADVALMQDDLAQFVTALKLSRATMRTVKVNIGLSLGVKFAFLLLVLSGHGTMWLAVLADMGTSLLVTLNGMRMLRWQSSA